MSKTKTTVTRTAALDPTPVNVAESMGGRRATINDIARLANVSKKTVSRVINQSPFVKEATRAKIDAVIQQIGYAPDPQARGLAFRRSDNSIFGAFAPAIRQISAFAAITRQGFAFGRAKLILAA